MYFDIFWERILILIMFFHHRQLKALDHRIQAQFSKQVIPKIILVQTSKFQRSFRPGGRPGRLAMTAGSSSATAAAAAMVEDEILVADWVTIDCGAYHAHLVLKDFPVDLSTSTGHRIRIIPTVAPVVEKERHLISAEKSESASAAAVKTNIVHRVFPKNKYQYIVFKGESTSSHKYHCFNDCRMMVAHHNEIQLDQEPSKEFQCQLCAKRLSANQPFSAWGGVWRPVSES